MPLTIPEYITVKDATGNPVAFLSPQADKLSECWIDQRLNEETTLQFRLPMFSPKLSLIEPESQIYVGGKAFSVLKPDAIDTIRDDEGKMWAKVMAEERWKLLDKHFVTINNDPDYPAPEGRIVPDVGNVTIISGGEDLSGGLYSVGSSAHALYALLKETDWTLGTVDVDGTHDMETDKLTVLENIQEVIKIWGGYLVWDSENKILHHRAEDTWQNYTGFQIRYGKNLKNITRTADQNIVTKLYPFGENDLDIASVNNGVKYLENYSYTNNVYIGVWKDPKIEDPQELKDKATEVLAKMCQPRYTYQQKIIDLRSLPGYEHESFELGDIIDIIDEELDIDIRARIVRYRYNVFMPWQCEIEVGEPEERLSSQLARNVAWTEHFTETVKNKKQVKTFDVITAIDFGTSKYKKRTLTVTGGVVTGIGEEGGWL